MMRLKLTTISAALLAAAMTGLPLAWAESSTTSSANGSQVPQPDPGGVNWQGVGIGAGTIAGNVFYIPAKLVYGILGGIGGGAGYALTGGNEQVANTIWRSSLGGDYVLTPDMISGKQPIHFSGPTQTAQPAPGAANESSGRTSVASSSLTNPPPAPRSYSDTTAHPIDSGAGPLGTGSAVSSEPIDTSVKPAPSTYKSNGSTAKRAAPSSSSIE